MAGFVITYLFSPVIAFDVTNSEPCSSNTATFDTIIINEGGGWNSTLDAFVAPTGGIYYFSVSFGLTVNSWGFFTINGATEADYYECCELNYIDNNNSVVSLEIMSRGTFLNLNKGRLLSSYYKFHFALTT